MAAKNKDDGLELFDTVSAHNKGTRVELKIARGPDAGKGSGYFISILGKDSTVARDLERQSANELIKRAQRARKRGLEAEPESVEFFEEKAIERLVKLTINAEPWEMPESAGEFTEENIRALYTKYPAIRRQMEDEVNNEANF